MLTRGEDGLHNAPDLSLPSEEQLHGLNRLVGCEYLAHPRLGDSFLRFEPEQIGS